MGKPEVYDRLLLESVYTARGGWGVEVVPILNDRGHHSAAAALNLGLENSRAPVVIFAHQDVLLVGADWFDRLSAVLGGLPWDWGTVSAAGIGLGYDRRHIGPRGGAIGRRTVAVGTVWDSVDNLLDPPYWDGDKATQPIHCAEECLMVLRRGTGLRHDAAYAGFHLYGVDLSLQARAAGYGCWGADLPIVHASALSGSRLADGRYWRYLRYLHHKWSPKFPECYATHCHWNREGIVSYLPAALDDEHGRTIVKVRAQGVRSARLTDDHHWGIIE